MLVSVEYDVILLALVVEALVVAGLFVAVVAFVDVAVFVVDGVALDAGINFIFVASESVVSFVSGCFLSHSAFCLS